MRAPRSTATGRNTLGGERLTRFQLWAYGGLTIPLSVAGLPVAIYVAPLYVDHLGLTLTTVGLALMATRLIDIVIDPLVGRLSDNTRGRFGRRAPWVAAGVPVMLVGTWLTFMPTGEVTGLDLFVRLVLFYAGWTMIVVPYAAWGAELSSDYHERSRISGTREIMSIGGLLFAVTFPLLIRPKEEPGLSEIAVETAAMVADVGALGLATILLLPPLAALMLTTVPSSAGPRTQAKFGIVETVSILKNRPFLLLLLGTFFAGLSSGMSQTTVIHYYQYRAGIGSQADAMIFYFFLAAIIGAVFWTRLGRALPKHHVVAISSTMSLVASTAILLVPRGEILGFAIIQLLSGFAYAGPLILGASMAADVIDFDWLRTGLQRGAVFIALWGMGRKLSEALGVGIGLPLLQALGFSPAAPFTAGAQLGLVLVNVALPALFAALAIPFILYYPIDERRQIIIRRAIDRREQRLGRQISQPTSK